MPAPSTFRIRPLLALALAAWTAGCGGSTPVAPRVPGAIQEAETAAYEILRQGDAAAIGIAITTREGLAWTRTYGLVDLDAPLVRYLPAFRMADPRYRDITVGMLLDHSAGFPGTSMIGALAFEPDPGYAARTMASLSTSRPKDPPGSPPCSW